MKYFYLEVKNKKYFKIVTKYGLKSDIFYYENKIIYIYIVLSNAYMQRMTTMKSYCNSACSFHLIL